MHKVLTYGTLRKGNYNHAILAAHNALALGETTVTGTLFDLGPYPALSLKSGRPIVCEGYEVTDECLERLDRLEGHPQFYRRTEIQSEYGPAFIYTIDHDPTYYSCDVIHSGDWNEHRRSKANRT
jgi:gamma-glutamylcyclotransferase (GGCT)/AIG2-like uncharacterized protein YtfP